jgi:hypothetical protein
MREPREASSGSPGFYSSQPADPLLGGCRQSSVVDRLPVSRQGLMSITAPSCTAWNTSSISAFVSAMHPFVQS